MLSTILLLSLLGCISMMIQDASGTVMVVAENRGNGRLAGFMDVTGDMAKFVMYSFSGMLLMTGYGWLGRLFLLPILATGFATTDYVTKWSAKHVPDKVDGTQNERIKALENKIEELERGQYAKL